MRLYIVCAAFIVASCPALSQSAKPIPPLSASKLGDPEAVYAQFHRAMMAGDLATMERHASQKYIHEYLTLATDRDNFRNAASLVSPSYRVARRGIEGSQAMLEARAQAGPAFGGGQAIGWITLVKQGQEWRVDQAAWMPLHEEQKVDPPRPVQSPTPPAKLTNP